MHQRRRNDDEKQFGSGSFGTGSFGSDEFTSPLFTPRRAAAADEVSRSNSFAANNLPFDHALTQGRFGTESGGFGLDSFNAAPTRNSSLVQPISAGGKKFSMPSSLADASRRTGSSTMQLNEASTLPRSPSHGPAARVLRSQGTSRDFAAGTSSVPVQSLRDSPFMKAQAPTPRNGNNQTTRIQTPFDSDASPIRPLANTFTPAGSKQQEEKTQETPAARLFGSTPFASPEDPWPSGVVATPSSHVAQTGLGFGQRNPCAVTVFGFAPSQAARVLARFYGFGEVVAREDAQSDGASQPNWTHLLYRTPVAASMALAQNGRIIDGCMVGVKPRTDQPTEGVRGSKSTFNTPAADRTGSIFERSGRKPAHTPAASLNGASIYAAPQSTTPESVRKSFCTKLIEYLFNY